MEVKRTLPKIRQQISFVKDNEEENYSNNQTITLVDEKNNPQSVEEVIDHHPKEEDIGFGSDNYVFKSDEVLLKREDDGNSTKGNSLRIVLELLALIFVTSLIAKIWQG